MADPVSVMSSNGITFLIDEADLPIALERRWCVVRYKHLQRVLVHTKINGRWRSLHLPRVLLCMILDLHGEFGMLNFPCLRRGGHGPA